jgi:hypothetical protein
MATDHPGVGSTVNYQGYWRMDPRWQPLVPVSAARICRGVLMSQMLHQVLLSKMPNLNSHVIHHPVFICQDHHPLPICMPDMPLLAQQHSPHGHSWDLLPSLPPTWMLLLPTSHVAMTPHMDPQVGDKPPGAYHITDVIRQGPTACGLNTQQEEPQLQNQQEHEQQSEVQHGVQEEEGEI